MRCGGTPGKPGRIVGENNAGECRGCEDCAMLPVNAHDEAIVDRLVEVARLRAQVASLEAQAREARAEASRAWAVLSGQDWMQTRLPGSAVTEARRVMGDVARLTRERDEARMNFATELEVSKKWAEENDNLRAEVEREAEHRRLVHARLSRRAEAAERALDELKLHHAEVCHDLHARLDAATARAEKAEREAERMRGDVRRAIGLIQSEANYDNGMAILARTVDPAWVSPLAGLAPAPLAQVAAGRDRPFRSPPSPASPAPSPEPDALPSEEYIVRPATADDLRRCAAAPASAPDGDEVERVARVMYTSLNETGPAFDPVRDQMRWDRLTEADRERGRVAARAVLAAVRPQSEGDIFVNLRRELATARARLSEVIGALVAHGYDVAAILGADLVRAVEEETER